MIPKTPSVLVFFVNGHKICENNVNPEWTLLSYLRNQLKLIGTKLGCGEGGCGTCTVMLSKYNRKSGQICNVAVNACLIPLCSLHGYSVTTIEGIGSVAKGLHPVQERIAKCHGTQCGFCTPGMVMSMYTLLRSRTESSPSKEDVQMALQGNLCRCTGYRPIFESFKTLTQEGCCGGMVNGKCCQENGSIEKKADIEKLYSPSDFKPYDATQDPIFPPELMSRSDYDEEFLFFKGERVSWYRPVTLESLMQLKFEIPNATIVAGNTKLGIDVKDKLFPVLIQSSQVNELLRIKVEESGIRFGSSITLSEMERVLQSEVKTQPEFKTRIFAAIIEMLKWFGGTQIRNVATVGGVISSQSATSDLIPIFMASQCQLLLQNGEGSRTVVMDKTFFNTNHQSILQKSEIILSILIPSTEKEEHCFGFKQARRRDCDTAIVNAAMFIRFQSKENKIIEDIRFAFGGIAPSTIMSHAAAALLIGKHWDENIVNEATEVLQKDLALLNSSNELVDLKNSLILSFLYKFYLLVSDRLGNQIPDNLKSAMDIHKRIAPKGFQLFESVSPEQPNWDALRRPLAHHSALLHATGESIFIDDMPKFENELYLALVVSTKANARIISIDAEDALKEKGVVDFISSKDIPEERSWKGAVIADEEIFASEMVSCVGQVIAAIVAVDKHTAQRAAKLVKIDYEEISPIILTIQDAIENKSFYNDWTKCLNKGDVEKGFAEADEILEGEMNIGGQEHFYLETNTSIALPKLENGEMEIFTSCQHPSSIQNYVSNALGIPQNRIVVRVKRIGGGFGGKESRPAIVAIPLAIAAQKLGRPVRCMLDRDEDMTITGGRHPFFCRYKVGFKRNGRVLALKLEMYNNGGNSIDLSPFVMESAMLNCDGAYKIENMNITGIVCKTNISSNTAFRGFGNPQALLFCETIIGHIAQKLDMDPVKVRQLNMYIEGDKTHYNQVLENCTLRKCWEECLKNSDYNRRRNDIRNFNEKNRWKKRGLSIIPTKFGVTFVPLFLNQGAAFVNVYRDGSVLLSHGGTEMGQGLYTKMIQVASRTLGISADKIHTLETSTSTVPNTMATAASTGSDLNGMAVLNACQTVRERLKPIMEANPDGKWEEWINSAYFDRISLSATGFYSTEGISGYDMITGKGTPYKYFSYGAACSEVEIDCLTGNHVIKRTDIVMDVGESLNPGIDVGQIEGAFTQGCGLFTLEELRLSPKGKLLTNGPSTYKIPTLGDIPSEFNVSLLRGAPNPKAVYSSKGIGEPPLFLAASVFFAIKQAVTDARKENGLQGPFPFDSPATFAKIHMLCANNSTAKSATP